MARTRPSSAPRNCLALALFSLFFILFSATAAAQPPPLSERAKVLRALVADLIRRDPTMAATLLRLAFHDSFTVNTTTGEGGANGSIRFEMDRDENGGLARAVNALEPMVAESKLGWADAIAVAGAQAVESTGGPHIRLRLGRVTANQEDPRFMLPSSNSSIDDLRQIFKQRGFSDRDIVTLSGAHTLGIDRSHGRFCALPNKFKNDYFVNLMWIHRRRQNGQTFAAGPPNKPNFQLPSDLALLDDPATVALVRRFANSETAFFTSFARAYKKMVNLGTSF